MLPARLCYHRRRARQIPLTLSRHRLKTIPSVLSADRISIRSDIWLGLGEEGSVQVRGVAAVHRVYPFLDVAGQ